MIRDILKYRRMSAWLAMAFALAILVTYNIALAARQWSLRERIAETQESAARLRVEIKQGEKVRNFVEGIYNASCGYDHAILSMLPECQSREDFVVREGPRFAWSELSSSTDDTRRIGIYVPAGSHWLKYAVGNGARLTADERTRFRYGDAREVKGAVACELGADAEVYEIVFKADAKGPLRIAVFGRESEPIHEQAQPVIEGPCTLRANEVAPSFAFPSELKPEDAGRPYFLGPRPPPAVDVAVLYVPTFHATIRVWVESEAPACMPAVYVAANYDEVTSLRYQDDNPPAIDRIADADAELARLFEPYDGSGRYYFRDAVFATNFRN